MFNTDFIHFLQSFDYPWLHSFMLFISALGIIPVILAFVLGITFAFDFRKGVVLINILTWTSLATVILKENINYPVPSDVDLSIRNEFKKQASTDLKDLQPKDFFETFSKEVLSTTQNDEFERFGFPSGNTSIQVALCLSIMLLFKKRTYIFIGISLILLTMLSRMYLGYHYLGDIIGGLAIGVAISLILLRYIKEIRFYTKRTHNYKSLSFLAFPLILLFFPGFFNPKILGGVIGINVAFLLQILIMNVPVNNGYGFQRFLTALIGVTIFLTGYYIPHFFGFPIKGYLGILIMASLSFISFFGALALCRKINLIRT